MFWQFWTISLDWWKLMGFPIKRPTLYHPVQQARCSVISQYHNSSILIKVHNLKARLSSKSVGSYRSKRCVPQHIIPNVMGQWSDSIVQFYPCQLLRIIMINDHGGEHLSKVCFVYHRFHTILHDVWAKPMNTIRCNV